MAGNGERAGDERRINRERMSGIWSCKRDWDLNQEFLFSYSKMNIEFSKILNCKYIIDMMNKIIQVIYEMKRKKWEIEFEFDLYFKYYWL